MSASRRPGAAALTLSVALLATSAPARAQPVATSEAPSAAPLPMRLAIQAEGATGVATGAFYNQLIGARLDLQFSPRVSFGGALAYVNVKAKDGRASNALPLAQLEYLAGTPGAPVRIPLRFSTGYLPRNGPVVRMSAGLAFALSPRIDLVAELGPMFWLSYHQMLLSMNGALELAFRL